jgi:hypothetical protein
MQSYTQTFDKFINEAKKRKKILVPRRSKERSLQKIQRYIKNGCKGDLDLHGRPIIKLPDNLKKVGGSLHLFGTQIKALPDNLKVGGSLNLHGTPIKTLPDGLNVGRNLDLGGTQIKTLPNDLKVEGKIIGKNIK